MRCFSRSTVSFSRVARAIGVVALAVTIAGGGSVTAAMNDGPAKRDATPSVERAIVDAVRERVGETVDVSVTLGHVRLVGDEVADLEARPAPGARLARPTRFTLYQKGAEAAAAAARVGYAVAETHVSMEHVRAARPIGRGTVLTEDDLVSTTGDIGAVPLKPLPTHRDLIGAMASRALRSGDLMTTAVIRLPKLVRARESVVVSVQIGAVTVFGRATATENGELGEVISLLNEQSGRRLRGRVVALGEVEVVP